MTHIIPRQREELPELKPMLPMVEPSIRFYRFGPLPIHPSSFNSKKVA